MVKPSQTYVIWYFPDGPWRENAKSLNSTIPEVFVNLGVKKTPSRMSGFKKVSE